MKILDPLRKLAANAALDAVAIVPGPNFRRLLGRDFHLMERPLLVIVPTKGDAVAIVPNLEMASFSTLGFEGTIVDWRDETGYLDAFAAAGAALGPKIKTIGLEAQRMRVFEQMALADAMPEAQFTDAHHLISSLRIHKTAQEISDLRKAIAISEAALDATLAEVKVGQTEKQVEAILMRQLFEHGAEGFSFAPIIAAGDNSAQPHAHARSDYHIKRGDALLIDFGASYRGMNADITRTFFMGEVSDYDRVFYETVLAANAAGKAATKAGTTAHAVDDAVQCVMEASKFAQFARHKTGHGLGLDVHEAPQIMRGNHAMLEEGMVFTVEPGLYRLGECGVRIEDDILVTSEGMDCLTNYPRDLRILL